MLGIKARDFFMEFYRADIPLVAVENPVPSKLFVMPEYSQIIQPYQFGHPYTKRTCLWLRNLPPLEPTNTVINGMVLFAERIDGVVVGSITPAVGG